MLYLLVLFYSTGACCVDICYCADLLVGAAFVSMPHRWLEKCLRVVWAFLLASEFAGLPGGTMVHVQLWFLLFWATPAERLWQPVHDIRPYVLLSFDLLLWLLGNRQLLLWLSTVAWEEMLVWLFVLPWLLLRMLWGFADERWASAPRTHSSCSWQYTMKEGTDRCSNLKAKQNWKQWRFYTRCYIFMYSPVLQCRLKRRRSSSLRINCSLVYYKWANCASWRHLLTKPK